jgi:O-antigen/teichoic acid export membrane protein
VTLTVLVDKAFGRPGMIRGSLLSVAARFLDLPSRYGFHLLVAAALGVERAGQFYIVFSVMTALGGLGRLGVDRALTRHLAIALAEGRPAAVRPAIGRALLLVSGASALASVLLFAAAQPFARLVLGKPDLAVPLALGALAIIPQNLGAAMAGGLAGLQRVGFSQMIYSWLWPALFCLIALITGISLEGALLLIALSFSVTALVGGALLRAFLPTGQDGMPVSAPALLRPGLSLFTLELTQLMTAAAPALILGILASSREVGLFALAWRIALLINIVVSGVAAMASPRYAALHAGADHAGLGRTASQAVGLCLALTAVPVVAMLVFPMSLLGLFGPGYADGAMVLRVLALGQLAAAASASMPELLGMTGHMADLRRLNGLSLLVLLLGAAGLAGLCGALGAALAVSASIAVNGFGAVHLAHRRLGLCSWAPLAAVVLGRGK